jgi:hypothetical protein
LPNQIPVKGAANAGNVNGLAFSLTIWPHNTATAFQPSQIFSFWNDQAMAPFLR